MTKRTAHRAITLRGSCATHGISVTDGRVPFAPRWGLTRHNTGFIASSPVPDGGLEIVHVAIVEGSVVLVPCTDEPSRELVLVQQYSSGSGRKRWPGFRVRLGQEAWLLSEVSTSGGSGEEHWVLISAPLGWSGNVSGQFVDERDYGDQIVSYNPDKHGSDLPKELLITFRGNEEITRKFMKKVDSLPSDRVDDHIIRTCGRARVKAHLVEISGDPDFFLGADPNQIIGYITECMDNAGIHEKSESREKNVGTATLDDLCRKWGSH